MSKRTPITLVLLCVLALRSLLPAGFMVQAADASDAPFEIVICTSSGPQVIHAADDDGNTPAQKSQAVDDGLCPFGANGVAAALDTPPSLAQTVQYSAVTYTLTAALFAETPKPGAASARGPPSRLI